MSTEIRQDSPETAAELEYLTRSLLERFKVYQQRRVLVEFLEYHEKHGHTHCAEVMRKLLRELTNA